MKKFILFGKEAMGTSLTKEILQESFKANRVNNGGIGGCEKDCWKHGALTVDTNLPLVICIRHPLSWLWSYWRYGVGDMIGKGFDSWEDFLGWRVGCNRHIHYWNFYGGYWRYITQNSNNSILWVRFEDWLKRPEWMIDQVSEIFDWEIKETQIPVKGVGPNGKKRSLVTDRELNMKWMDQYEGKLLRKPSENKVDFFKKQVDNNLMNFFGYKIEDNQYFDLIDLNKKK